MCQQERVCVEKAKGCGKSKAIEKVQAKQIPLLNSCIPHPSFHNVPQLKHSPLLVHPDAQQQQFLLQKSSRHDMGMETNRLRDLNTCDRIQETSFAYMELLQVVLFLFCLCSGFCFYSIHIQIFSSEILTLSHGSSFYEWLKDSERKLNIMIVCIYLLIKCLKEGDMHVVTQHTGSVAQISTWFIDWSLQ